jgi:hypothetical protein
MYEDYKFACFSVWCETWSLTLTGEHRLRVFESRVLRWIFGPKGNKVKGGWRKLYNKELCDLYPSRSIIKMIKSRWMRWIGNVARMVTGGKLRGYCWESQREISIEKPRRMWVDNIMMDLEAIG